MGQKKKERVEVEDEVAGKQLTNGLRRLLGNPEK